MNSVILFHIVCGIVIALTGYSITTLPAMHSDDGLESAAQRRLPTMIYQVVGICIFLAVAAAIYAGATYLAAHNPGDSVYRSLTSVTGALLIIVGCMRIMTIRGPRGIIGTSTLVLIVLGFALLISGQTLP